MKLTKITLFGITVICVTVLCFTIIVGERLCSLNISNGNTVVQAILMCNK
ncbi:MULTISPECIES: Hok/Gef family protein [Proteus]